MGHNWAASRVGAWTLMALALALQLPFFLLFEGWPRASDFVLIHGAARHALDGGMISAYRVGPLMDGGELRNTVWSYPPPFNLFIAPLGLLPLRPAFAVLTTLTLGAYLVVLSRLARDARGVRFTLAAMAPSALTVIWGGQTGFLTGALVSAFALLHRRGSGWAGLPLGVMVIKPHLVLGIGLLLLMTRDWRTLGVAASTAAVLSAAATVAFGPEIWTAFLDAGRQTAEQFSTGYHPYRRTLSLYGSLRSFGIAHGPALVAHVALVVVGVAALGVAIRRGWAVEHRLALAIAVSLTVSPYAYDYDAALLAVALALLASDFATASRPLRAAILVLCWLCGASSFAFRMTNLATSAVLGPGFVLSPQVTMAGFALALTLWALWRAAERDRSPRTLGEKSPVGAGG